MSNKHLVVSFIVLVMTLWVFSGEWSNSIVEAQESAPVEFGVSEEMALVRAVQSRSETRVTCYAGLP